MDALDESRGRLRWGNGSPRSRRRRVVVRSVVVVVSDVIAIVIAIVDVDVDVVGDVLGDERPCSAEAMV